MTTKRKRDTDSHPRSKRVKVTETVDVTPRTEPVGDQETASQGSSRSPKSEHATTKEEARVPLVEDKLQKAPLTRPKRRINKLQPPRPFPTVPTSVSATGPRSAQLEGKNLICVTRKTSLSAYMRRCKDVVIKDGYKMLHLSAMGAAIPHLLQLVAALPTVLPFDREEIRTEIFTGTVDVRDEVIPEDDEEDTTYQIRGKSTLSVVVKVGDGQREGDRGSASQSRERKDVVGKTSTHKRNKPRKGKEVQYPPQPIVFQEPEQSDMEAE